MDGDDDDGARVVVVEDEAEDAEDDGAGELAAELHPATIIPATASTVTRRLMPPACRTVRTCLSRSDA